MAVVVVATGGAQVEKDEQSESESCHCCWKESFFYFVSLSKTKKDKTLERISTSLLLV